MKINKSLETPEGSIQFVGELEGQELDIVIQLGLLALTSRGFIKTVTAEVPPKGEQH